MFKKLKEQINFRTVTFTWIIIGLSISSYFYIKSEEYQRSKWEYKKNNKINRTEMKKFLLITGIGSLVIGGIGYLKTPK